MCSQEIEKYIGERNGRLSKDEIFYILDYSHNPQIDHVVCNNKQYKVWDYDGNYYTFEVKVGDIN